MASAREVAKAFYQDQLAGHLELAERMMSRSAQHEVGDYEQSEGRVQGFTIVGSFAEVMGVPYGVVAKVTRSGKSFNESVLFMNQMIVGYASSPEGLPPSESLPIRPKVGKNSGF